MSKDYIENVYYEGSAVNLSFHNPTPTDERDDPTGTYAARIVLGGSQRILDNAEAALSALNEAGIKPVSNGAYGSQDRDLSVSAPQANAKPDVRTAWNSALKKLGSRFAHLPITKIYVDAPTKIVSLQLKDEPITGMQRLAVLDEIEDIEKTNIPADSYRKAKNQIFPLLEEELADRLKNETGNPLNITTDGIVVGNYASRFSGFKIEISQSKVNDNKVLIKAKFSDSRAIISDAEKIDRAKQVKLQIKEFLAAKKIKAEEASTIDETSSWGRFDSFDGNGIYVENMPLDEVVKALATPLNAEGSNMIPSIYASDEVQEAIRDSLAEAEKDAGHTGKAKRSKADGVVAGKA